MSDSETPIYHAEASDPLMLEAFSNARTHFKSFWRELSWEWRRIIPGLDYAMVKLPFWDDEERNLESKCEHMWVTDVLFDGRTLTGTLANSPNELTSVKEGDTVSAPLGDLSDWMISSGGKAYGGFTVHLMRSQMNRGERKAHDAAWGLDFGDFEKPRIETFAESDQPKKSFFGLFAKKTPPVQSTSADHEDHPMCLNCLPQLKEQIKEDPSFVTNIDEDGWTILHREALAGNLAFVKILIEQGATASTKTPKGDDAAALARMIGWNEIAAFLETTK